MTLKEITLEILEKYNDSKTSVIYEYSGTIDKDLDDLSAEIERYTRQIDIANMQNRGGWIPVTEQTLPNHNSVVVVCGEKGTWDFGTYRGHASTNIHFWNWKKNTVKKVHWWMYKEDALPKPWKGEDDGKPD